MGKRSLQPQRGFFPQPVYLIGTYKEDGNPNFAVITWITFCSVNPPMIMFASRGKKLTRELIEKNGMFSANLATKNMMFMTDYFGNTSGYEKNKCEDIKVEYSKGNALNVPVLKESPWIYECSLVDVIEKGSGYIYIGEIKNILVDEVIEDTGYGNIDMITIDPLIYAPGQYYGITKGIGTVGFSKKIRETRLKQNDIKIIKYDSVYAEDTVRMRLQSKERALGIKDMHSFEDNMNFLNHILTKDNEVYIAIDNNKVVGMIAFNENEINQLYIHNDYQGKGLGRKLMDLAKANSKGRLTLYTFEINHKAQRFYENNGFKIIGRGYENEENLDDIKYEWVGSDEENM